MNLLNQASTMLLDAAASGQPCEPVRNLIGDTDVQSAYQVQALVNAHRARQGDALIGHKIGLTSPAVQKQLGVDQPDYGSLFSSMELMNGGKLRWEETMQAKAEAEIGFILGKDLAMEHPSISQVLSAIEYVVPCIEIVGSRVKDWNIKITDTIADNASASHFVIGHAVKRLHEVDVVSCDMSMFKNGEKVSEGHGGACLGSPINATWWLAKTMKQLGSPLRAGQIILAGALGPMAAASSGDEFTAHISGLGSVSMSFT